MTADARVMGEQAFTAPCHLTAPLYNRPVIQTWTIEEAP